MPLASRSEVIASLRNRSAPAGSVDSEGASSQEANKGAEKFVIGRGQLRRLLRGEVFSEGLELHSPQFLVQFAKEKELGQKAKDFLKDVLLPESRIKLTKVTEDKYGGRVVASVVMTDGEDIGQLLLKRGMAFTYNGRTKRSWCNLDN